MIKIDNVTFAYRKGATALTDVNCSYGPGIHLILGPNGAGKTTLLSVIAGLCVPQKGQCNVDGTNIALHTPASLRDIFFLPEDCRFPLDTIDDMVSRHSVFYPTFSPEKLMRYLGAFGIAGNERLADLSLGNRKKACFAYALALGTPTLLLDEPANGLDIESKRTLTRLMASAADDERYIFVSTHNIHDMRYLFDSVTVLDGSHVLLSATTAEIVSRLAFVTDSVASPDALYTESDVNGCHQILPAIPDEPTDIDYILLYSALTRRGSQAREAIMNLFSTK